MKKCELSVLTCPPYIPTKFRHYFLLFILLRRKHGDIFQLRYTLKWPIWRIWSEKGLLWNLRRSFLCFFSPRRKLKSDQKLYQFLSSQRSRSEGHCYSERVEEIFSYEKRDRQDISVIKKGTERMEYIRFVQRQILVVEFPYLIFLKCYLRQLVPDTYYVTSRFVSLWGNN